MDYLALQHRYTTLWPLQDLELGAHHSDTLDQGGSLLMNFQLQLLIDTLK